MRKTIKALAAATVVTCAMGSTPASAAGRDLRGAPSDWVVVAQGVFRPPGRATNAYTYNRRLAPEGSRAVVVAYYVPVVRMTVVTLGVGGLRPNRVYGAHVHVSRCGRTGEAAGGHYQRRPAPGSAAANPGNEVWLDFTTDDEGDGVAASVHTWRFDHRRPRSVVIHEHRTRAGGEAGGRVACLTVRF